MLSAVLLANLAATLFMTGAIWFVQVVHYPLFDGVCTEFPAYHKRHSALTTWIVGPPMLVEAATAALLLLIAPPKIAAWLLWAGLALVVVNWVSTAALQVPCHQLLAKGFAARSHKRLVVGNWLRTAAWTLRSALMLYATFGLLADESSAHIAE